MSAARKKDPTAAIRSRNPSSVLSPVNLALVMVSLLLAAALIEFGSWLWVEYLRPAHLTKWEFAATRPPPYREADYFGPEFLEEAQKSVSGHLGDVAELADFRGRYFNVRGGFRVTTDLPQRPTRRVLLFGGSTLFGQEVPDSLTIASYLQRMLNARGVRWQVMNFGLVGMNAAQQTRILARVVPRQGDIVVFYHGVNDIYYSVFGGYLEGWVGGVPAFRPVQKLGGLHKILHAWHQRLKDYSYTAQVALDIYQRGQPTTVTDPAELARNIELAQAQFREAVTAAARIAGAAGAEFVHFLQPQIFANARMSAYERALIANPLGTAPGVETAFRQGYPKLLQAAQDLARQGIAFHDISDALDRRPEGEEVFLDFCHVAHRGNELVAQRLMQDYFQARIAR
jgi:hypothetical protein